MGQTCSAFFLRGFFFGVLAAAIVGFVAARIFWALGQARQAFRPQAVVHHTPRTPWQVLIQSLTSCLSLVLWAIVLLVVCVALVAVGQVLIH